MLRHQDHEKSHWQPEGWLDADHPPDRAISPGKRTLTMSLPARPITGLAPIQARFDPAIVHASGQALEDVDEQDSSEDTGDQDSGDDTGLVEDWMNAAIRPDLHEAPVQRMRSGNTHSEPASFSAAGSGQRLPGPVQASMEEAFASDFSAVRIHEGADVAAMGALAYTRGSDIHFAPGQYAPNSERGKELLGHELAHVVQQASGRVAATAQRKGVAINEDMSLEREADELGARAARGERVQGQHAAPAASPRPAASMGPVAVQYMKVDRAEKYGGGQVDTEDKSFTQYLAALVEAGDMQTLYVVQAAVKTESKASQLVSQALNDATDKLFGPSETPKRKPSANNSARQSTKNSAPSKAKSATKATKATKEPPLTLRAIKDKVVDHRVEKVSDRGVLAALLSSEELGTYDTYQNDHEELLFRANKKGTQSQRDLETLGQEVAEKLVARFAAVAKLVERCQPILASKNKCDFLHVYGQDGAAHVNKGSVAEDFGRVTKMLNQAGVAPSLLATKVPITSLASLASTFDATPGIVHFLATYQAKGLLQAVQARGEMLSLSRAREELQRDANIDYLPANQVASDQKSSGQERKGFATSAAKELATFGSTQSKESLTSAQKLAIIGKDSVESLTTQEKAKYHDLTPHSQDLTLDEQERLQKEMDTEKQKLPQKVRGIMQLVLADSTDVKKDLQVYVSGGPGSSDYSYGSQRDRKHTGQGTGDLGKLTYPVTGQTTEDYKKHDVRHIGHHEEQRDNDAEVKILEQTIALLTEQQENGKTIAGATLRLYVSRYTCPSCSDTIYRARTENPILQQLGKIEVIYEGNRTD